MKIRTFTIVLGLELYATLLALSQYLVIGIRTDEAKYLLNIPYPHPPLARWMLGLTDGWMYQELLWRIVFATLLVQAVWIVLSMAHGLSRSSQVALAAGWLLSSALMIQAGTVMMAPLTALQALVFVKLLLSKQDHAYHAWLVALFWLGSLFTAYQAVLFFPIVLAVFWRMRLPLIIRLVLFAVPVALLCLYTLTNPLALASMVLHAEKDAVQTIGERTAATGFIFLLGGSVVLSIVGLLGLLLSRRLSLLLSLLLLIAYIFVGRYAYYAILFLPLFIAGFIVFSRKVPVFAVAVALLVPLGTLLLLWRSPWLIPMTGVSPERALRVIEKKDQAGDILIAGPFGHEWQYASRKPVRRYQAQFLSQAAAVVCLRPCEEMLRQTGWERRAESPEEVWERVR